jgi:hypothetical protein
VLGAAEARRHRLHAGHGNQQAVVQHIAADSQLARHQPVFAIRQPQVVQAGVVAVAVDRRAGSIRQPELLLHQLQAAAHRGLVDLQGPRRLVLGARQLEDVENVQVLQGPGRGVGRRTGRGT